MAIILKANEVNLFVSSVLFVFKYHSPNFLNTPRISLPTTCAIFHFILHNQYLFVITFEIILNNVQVVSMEISL
jgi:hypothetical protein